MDVVEEKGDAVQADVVMLDRKVEETEGRVVALRGEVEELRGWTRELSSSLLRERESTRALTIEMGQMRHLVNGFDGGAREIAGRPHSVRHESAGSG